MGKINQGILGGVSGTVGNVVGGSWKGINYLRIKAASYSDAQSEVQVNQRNRFGACIALAKSIMDTIIKPIWNKKAVKMSGFNLFTKTNISVFDEMGEISDFENLKFSIGDLPLPTNLVIENNGAGNGAIVVTWNDNSGIGIAAPTDRLRMVALCNGELVVLQGLAFARQAQQANVQVPFGAGESVHIYVFFQNEENSKYSPDFHALVNIPAALIP
jgi:hypothetical protein